MLEQIARVLCWLCVGEIAARSGLLPFPAPVTGLMLLYGIESPGLTSSLAIGERVSALLG